jgi:hypothetical protein
MQVNGAGRPAARFDHRRRTAGREVGMRYDREITYLLGEGLKDADRRLAAAELVALLASDKKPTAAELDALEARLTAAYGAGACAACRELRAAIGFGGLQGRAVGECATDTTPRQPSH